MSTAGRTTGLYFFQPMTYAANVVVNPPAASATPAMTSNEIHSPHGYWSERFVTAPRPNTSR